MNKQKAETSKLLSTTSDLRRLPHFFSIFYEPALHLLLVFAFFSLRFVWVAKGPGHYDQLSLDRGPQFSLGRHTASPSKGDTPGIYRRLDGYVSSDVVVLPFFLSELIPVLFPLQALANTTTPSWIVDRSTVSGIASGRETRKIRQVFVWLFVFTIMRSLIV